MEPVAAGHAEHLQQTQLQHLDQSLAQQTGPRAQLAQLRIEADRARGLLDDTLTAVEEGAQTPSCSVLEVKAAAGEAAADAADLALRACGGSAFRKESPVERLFPRLTRGTGDGADDRRAATTSSGGPCAACRCSVMPHDGRCWARSRTTPKSSPSGTASGCGCAAQGLHFDYVLYSNYERQVEELIAGRHRLAWNSPLAWVRASRLARAAGCHRAPGHDARHRL